MSNAHQTKIGLSDFKINSDQSDQHQTEIDHDFFDNPCAASEQLAPGSSQGSLETGDKASDFRLNFDMTSLSSRRDLITASDRHFLPLQHAFPIASTTTGQYHAHSEEENDSGPHSSYFDLIDSSIESERASEELQRRPRVKLFDLSSSSSSSSGDSDLGLDDDESDDSLLDTEDEEFVGLLEKYYDYIDLGDSDEESDLTEVSPMSSFSDLSFHHQELLSKEECSVVAHADPVYKKNDYASEDYFGNRFPLSGTEKLPQSKPLPPLIIHTLEEVPIIRPKPISFAKGFVIPNQNSIPGPILIESSPTVKAVVDEVKLSEAIKKTEDDSDNKATSVSSLSTTSISSSFKSNKSIDYQNSSKNSCEQETEAKFQPNVETKNNKSKKRIERRGDDIKRGHHLTHGKGSIHHHRYGIHHQPIKASATIARQRQQKKVEHENSILVARLQNVKPSKEILEAFKSKCK